MSDNIESHLSETAHFRALRDGLLRCGKASLTVFGFIGATVLLNQRDFCRSHSLPFFSKSWSHLKGHNE